VSVEATAARSSGFASPLHFKSRSTSPLGARNVTAVGVLVHHLLLSPHGPPNTVTVDGHHPAFTRPVSGHRHQVYDPDANGYGDGSFDAIPCVTPTSAYFSMMSSMGSSSPTTTTTQGHPLASLPEPNTPFQRTHPSCNMNSPNAGFSPFLSSSHPPSPRNDFPLFHILIYSLPLQHSPSPLRRRPLLNRCRVYLASVDWGSSLMVLVGNSRVRD